MIVIHRVNVAENVTVVTTTRMKIRTENMKKHETKAGG